MPKRYTWLILILLAAASLRLVGLSEIPPGLTHDEADHGLDAWGVVNGIRPVYFTVGYGREPLFDYATAGLMAFLGPTYLAGRLTAVYLSLILIAGTYVWSRRAFGNTTALLTAAGLAVSFWAVLTGRQALRSIALPAIFVLAVYFYWRAAEKSKSPSFNQEEQEYPAFPFFYKPVAYYLVAGILLGLTFYTYIPARVIWLLFPALLLFLALFDRNRFQGIWAGTLLTLLVAGIMALPLILYLTGNPSAEVRLAELMAPLNSAAAGDLQPLLENVTQSSLVLAFRGDSQWRYNIPGRPILSPIMAILFFAGLGISLWRTLAGIKDRQRLPEATTSYFIIVWLLLGFTPVLLTGLDLSTTRIVGLQPVLYIFPAIALTAAFEVPAVPKRLAQVLTAILYLALTIFTVRDYFLVWANAPEVQVQYETALISTIDYLNEHGQGMLAISTTTPSQYHSPAVAFLTLHNPKVELRWFDGQHSLLVPHGNESGLIFSGFAPLSPYLEGYFVADYVDEVPQRPSEIDRPLTVYSADGQVFLDHWHQQIEDKLASPAEVEVPVHFGDAVEFLGYDLQTPMVTPGEPVRLATFWRLNHPLEEAVMYTHIVGPDGQPIAQADRLDAPSTFWVNGDLLIQLHEMTVPDSTAGGEYLLSVGIYNPTNLQRLPVTVGGKVIDDHLQLPPLTVTP
jgi:4-amino-4-deoxy-L-arabinose transferase-like glycosyltransferase